MYTFLESVRQGAPDEPIKMPKLVFFDPMGVSGNRNWSAKINFWAVGKKSKIYFYVKMHEKNTQGFGFEPFLYDTAPYWTVTLRVGAGAGWADGVG